MGPVDHPHVLSCGGGLCSVHQQAAHEQSPACAEVMVVVVFLHVMDMTWQPAALPENSKCDIPARPKRQSDGPGGQRGKNAGPTPALTSR